MKYQIEVGVPIPDIASRYPWDDMDIGDSFLVADRKASTVKNAAVAHAKRSGRKYTVRVQSDGSLRVWRIS